MSENTVEQKLTLKDKIKYFFINPKILFERFIEKPKFGINLLIIIISTIINVIISSKFSKDIVKKLMENQQKNLDPKTAEIAKKGFEVATNPIFQSISASVLLLISIFFTSLMIFLILKIVKSSLKYNQVVSIYVLASMTTVVHNILLILYTLILQKPAINPSTISNPTVTSVISSYINIFSIWQYVLIGIGIYAISKASRKKATIISVICFVLFTGILVALGLQGVK